jgi:hypothetical protein
MKRIPVNAMLVILLISLAFAHARSGKANSNNDSEQVARRAELQRIQAVMRSDFAQDLTYAGNHIGTRAGISAITKARSAAVEKTTQVFYGAPTPLPSGIFNHVYADGINDNGQIVGNGFLGGAPLQPLFWPSPTADPTALPTGYQRCGRPRHQQRWPDSHEIGIPWRFAALSGQARTLTRRRSRAEHFEAAAFGINDAYQIAESAAQIRFLVYSDFWSPSATHPLHANPSSLFTPANDINSGQIVGEPSVMLEVPSGQTRRPDPTLIAAADASFPQLRD